MHFTLMTMMQGKKALLAKPFLLVSSTTFLTEVFFPDTMAVQRPVSLIYNQTVLYQSIEE